MAKLTKKQVSDLTNVVTTLKRAQGYIERDSTFVGYEIGNPLGGTNLALRNGDRVVEPVEKLIGSDLVSLWTASRMIEDFIERNVN